jgi:small-conductance mechanosensitive channel
LHTEIQTEERDLTTLPNMYLVAHPVRVMHDAGSVLSVELSLGYDVSRHLVEELLIKAAKETALENPFVQIRELGDHSVTYRISGLLHEVNRLLDKRRELRARTMDCLHAAGVEIVSPNFMNTRAYDQDRLFIPEAPKHPIIEEPAASTDSIVFDKAEEAASVSNLRDMLQNLQERLNAVDGILAASKNAETTEAASTEKADLENRIDRLKALIDKKEIKIAGK